MNEVNPRQARLVIANWMADCLRAGVPCSAGWLVTLCDPIAREFP